MPLQAVTWQGSWRPDRDSLAGRVIMITGACGGLGHAAALACANAGANVVLSGRKVRSLEKLYDDIVALDRAEPAILPLDLAGASPADYDTVIEALGNGFGRLHGLLHAAAHFDSLTPLAMKKPDDWLLDLQVNLTAPFLLTQACLPLLESVEDSAVIFMVDDRVRLDRAHWSGYGVAKAGLERLASILHEETDDGPVRVHTVLPAPMRTALRRKAWFGEDSMQLPGPEATAEALVYLLGPEAASVRGKLLDLRPQAGRA